MSKRKIVDIKNKKALKEMIIALCENLPLGIEKPNTSCELEKNKNFINASFPKEKNKPL